MFLPRAQVDAGFSADRCVDHRDERRGDMQVGNAAHVRRGAKPKRSLADAAADADDQRFAPGAGRKQRVVHLLRPWKGACALRRAETAQDAEARLQLTKLAGELRHRRVASRDHDKALRAMIDERSDRRGVYRHRCRSDS